MSNKKLIDPDQILRILLPASEIPDGSTVSKRTGEKRYILSKEIKLYTKDKPLEVLAKGEFLCDKGGNITQIEPDSLLHWIISAENFKDYLQMEWDY